MMRRPARALTAATVVLSVTVGLAACGGEPESGLTTGAPTVSPSPSPSLDAAERVEQEHVEEAEAGLVDYYEDLARVANDGYGGWASLMEYWGTAEVVEDFSTTFADLHRQGMSTTGAAEVVSTESIEYVDDTTDASRDQVRLAACIDTSAVASVDADGEPVGSGGGRAVVEYLLVRTGEGGGWMIGEYTPRTEESC